MTGNCQFFIEKEKPMRLSQAGAASVFVGVATGQAEYPKGTQHRKDDLWNRD